MGLGSQDDKRRKDFRIIAGKHDWKALIKTPDDAEELIKKLLDIAKVDALLVASYEQRKINLLKEYIHYCKSGGVDFTLKEYERTSR